MLHKEKGRQGKDNRHNM